MVVIPAIDLKDGRCVRLRQGDLQAETVYSDDPAAMARHWAGLGATLLHVVDLNGAVEGLPKNLPQIEAILNTGALPVQVGGGIRSLETIRLYLSRGVSRVVLGTAALNDRQLLTAACGEFPGQILVGLDAKCGQIAIKGWTEVSSTSVLDILKTFEGLPLAGIIYTDIARDGMLEGPNLPSLREVLTATSYAVIASGGISSVADLLAVQALGSRISGAIVGKALYDKKLDFGDALRALSAVGA
jgi:phosphoribosylformimino-5-aminoimidazole carboxamide ribotide isomerase